MKRQRITKEEYFCDIKYPKFKKLLCKIFNHKWAEDVLSGERRCYICGKEQYREYEYRQDCRPNAYWVDK
ncbi:MAG: hypothetical protein KAS32_01710 [Candidatus Peribacteraceae bacterium]|nr:hypothetical protein [Candidatus Peribacteraceae bacterium]